MTESEHKIVLHKKVLLIAPQPFYEERGTPMNVRLMATILGGKGYVVDLVVFPTGRKIDIPGVNQITLPNILGISHIPIGFSFKKILFDGLLFVWCLWLCCRNNYDIIHGIEEGGFIAVFLGRIFRKSSIYDMNKIPGTQYLFAIQIHDDRPLPDLLLNQFVVSKI